MIEHIYLQPTGDDNTHKLSKANQVCRGIGSKQSLPVDMDLPAILTKRHFMSRSKLKLGKEHKVVFMLRDFKEIVFSYTYARTKHSISLEQYINNFHDKLDHEFKEWMHNFITYHNHTGEKHVVHYHDLISRPRVVLQLLTEFLGYEKDDKERMEKFFENVDTHADNCIKYKTKPGNFLTNTTYGKKMKYHPDMLKSTQHERIDQMMESCDPHAYKELQSIITNAGSRSQL